MIFDCFQCNFIMRVAAKRCFFFVVAIYDGSVWLLYNSV